MLINKYGSFEIDIEIPHKIAIIINKNDIFLSSRDFKIIAPNSKLVALIIPSALIYDSYINI